MLQEGEALCVGKFGGFYVLEQEASNPELVTHLDALAGSDLELPLGRHNLCVGARNVDTSVQAGLVVCLNNVALNDLASTNTAVVWALGGRETMGGLS